ncbi:MAG: molybdopterin dinucleotide binding domain-containing protein [Thermodesulfobacteriota bacterium]|nr:molybdopterin dinucleotide binding domain-containing protein [Thermodesulfobacteriota bacterium]
MRNIGSLKKRFPEPLVEINPITAERYGIKDGEKILVETKRGSIEIKSKVTENILKEVINISHGWEEANVNFLTDEFSCDPVSGYPGLKSLLCRIKKVEGG